MELRDAPGTAGYTETQADTHMQTHTHTHTHTWPIIRVHIHTYCHTHTHGTHAETSHTETQNTSDFASNTLHNIRDHFAANVGHCAPQQTPPDRGRSSEQKYDIVALTPIINTHT
jgi:hypothetical protein